LEDNFDAHKYGREFEDKLVEWLKEEGIDAINNEELYGKASESVESAVKNKERGDVLIKGTSIEIDGKRGYFIANNYTVDHPFRGWFALTNHEMEKSATVFIPANVIKKWISQRWTNTAPKWDKSSIGNEGIKFDPEYRRLNASLTWDQFLNKVKNASKTISD